MRLTVLFSALFLLPLVAPADALSRWGPSGCAAAEPVGSQVQVTPARYEWTKGTESQSWLWKGDQIVGQWHHPTAQYFPWDGKRVLAPCKPPIDPPGRAVEPKEFEKFKDDQGKLNFGVDLSKLAPAGGEVVTFSGQPIPPEQIGPAFEGKLTDDSSKGYFVVISRDQAKRQAVLDDWTKLPAAFRERYNVWSAPPEHFSMQDRFAGKPRFHVDGDPTVILQDKTGKVLFRHPKGPEQVYQPKDLQHVLKADPGYKPANDPGVPTPPAVPPVSVPLVLGGAALVGAALLIRSRK